MEVKVGDKIFSSKVDGELKVVRAMDPNTFECVEVNNTQNFHAVSINDILTHSREVEGEETEFDYKFEIDRSYFIYDPQGGQGDGESGEDGEEGEGEGDPSDEESEGGKGEGDGEPTDKEGDGEGQGEGEGEGEGKPSDKPGEGGSPGEDNGERGEVGEGDPGEGGEPAQIILTQKHPDEIIKETVRGKGKKRF